MIKVKLRQEAIEDLNSIWYYTLENGLKVRRTNIIQI